MKKHLFLIFLPPVILSSAALIADVDAPLSYIAFPMTVSAASSTLTFPEFGSLYDLALSQSLASVGVGKIPDPPPAPPREVPEPDPPEEAIPGNIASLTAVKGADTVADIEINNETAYDLSGAYREPECSGSVLIVHTHTSEAYRPSTAYPYVPTDNGRTEDTRFNVARVGDELAAQLRARGVTVYHDSTLCDYPSYNGSYQKSLGLMQSYLTAHPDIAVVIDLHRDAMESADGTVYRTVCTVDGAPCAQLMLVVGTDEGGLPHPDWRNNFSFAARLQREVTKDYPELMRPLNVRRERFNGHVSDHAVILEVGTTGNTLDEALSGIAPFAEALSRLLV